MSLTSTVLRTSRHPIPNSKRDQHFLLSWESKGLKTVVFKALYFLGLGRSHNQVFVGPEAAEHLVIYKTSPLLVSI